MLAIDIITQDQLDLFGRIRADAWFSDLPVLLQEKGVVQSDIDQALAGLNTVGEKNGVVVVVLMAELNPEASNDTAARWSNAVSIQVIETPLLNLDPVSGIGKSAALVATRIREILHLWANGYGGTWSFSKQDPLPVDEGSISYVVTFTRIGQDARIPVVETPRVTATAEAAPATVTITTVTPGAVIRYTLDGSYPAEGNAAAQLYAGPFEVAEAAGIRAIAEAADMRASNIRHLRLR